MKKLFILQIAIALFCIIGQIKCVIKMINCDWNPIGKSEIIYTAATFTGLGSIIGYINIQD
jgi:hypothetical protein